MARLQRIFPDPMAAHSLRRWAQMGACAGLLVALVYFAPAAWLASAIAAASDQRVLLADARGTVWSGSARLVLTGGQDSQDAAVLPERVQWTLRPRGLGVQAALLVQCCSRQAAMVHTQALWGGARLDISALQLQLPAAVLSGLGTPWNTLGLDGSLQLSSDQLGAQINEGRVQFSGSAVLDMEHIASPLSTLRPLGDYRLSLQGGAVPRIDLQTLQGALLLSGSGEWAGNRLRFNGEASATPEREAALSNLLNIIGRRQGARSLITL